MRLLTVFIYLLTPCLLFAQDPKIKYGKVSPEDLQRKVYALDSSAHAVILSDVGKTEIVGNNKGWFSLRYERHNRIHILNKNGYTEANIEIPLYTNGDAEEVLNNVKATTYNLENGTVQETKLDKSAIFTERKNKYLVIKKFTLPNVKEGSIIEYSYGIQSDFLTNLQPWSFQGGIPALWSEYTLSVPQFLDYAFLSQGYHPFFLKDKKDRSESFTIRDATTAEATERYTFTAGVSDHRWAMKDVPALKTESFTSSINNYLSRIEFQLAAHQHPLNYRPIMGTWPAVAKQLIESEDFGKHLYTDNNWMKDVLTPLVAAARTDEQKAKAIYRYLRDNITCTATYGIYAGQHIKNVLKTKNGRASEINLLLAAMLKHEGIEAEPVILSTKEHGFVYSIYPILSRFNYIVIRAVVDGKTVFLDATHPHLGFGKLLPECYNGHARVINTSANALDFQPDTLQERKVSALFITNNEKGAWEGLMNQTMGYYESYKTRERIAAKGAENFWKDIKTAYGVDLELKNQNIDSLNQLEMPIALTYNIQMGSHDEDILYISPMFGEGYKENPFKSAERLYPVEMPYSFDETFIATIEIPTGYTLDELPKSMKVKFNEEGEGYFEYLVSHSGNTISMRSRIKLDRATFQPDEYEILREFFNMIVTKQKEQIVFKKKK